MIFSKKVFFILLSCLFVVSCEQSYIDPENKMSRKDFEDSINKGFDTDKDFLNTSNRTTPPNISRLLVSPPPPPMGSGELISFSVTEDVPLKDVLIELGRVANVDIEVDPNISGGIILKATNKPLDIIVKRICELGSLRYSYTNNILRFETDTSYSVTYNLDFLLESDIWGVVESALNEIVSLNTIQNQSTSDTQGSQTQANQTKIIINKPAGMITVYASERAQKAVDNYIADVKKNYGAQVLIEAKVVEIVLDKDHQMGIDWNFTNTGKGSLQIGSTGNAAGGLASNITTAVFAGNLTNAISALETFGMTKTLSSPRVHAMNNQKAELKFVNKLIYFSLEKEDEEQTNTGNTVTTTTYTSTKQEENIGVTLTLIPTINLEKNEITLNVFPELKVKTGEVSDPTNELNKVPIIQTRSVDTSLKVKSGGILVIGGLMSEETISTDTGVPYLSGIPILGYLFKSTSRTKEVRETVIFLKATIIKSNGQVNSYDRGIYNKFMNNKDNFM